MRAPQIKINALSFALMMDAMMDGPCDTKELEEATGLHYRTILDYVNALHKIGVIHVAAWSVDDKGRFCRRHYAIGREKDCKKPRIDNAEKARRYRTNRKNRLIPFAIAGALA